MRTRPISVLVVEYEPLIRLNIVTAIEDDGWQVLEAGDALEAIAILAERPAVDVVFTDVDMPGSLNGLELVRIVDDLYPSIRLIVTSGHRNIQEADLPNGGRFLPKPYMSDTVLNVIAEIVQV